MVSLRYNYNAEFEWDDPSRLMEEKPKAHHHLPMIRHSVASFTLVVIFFSTAVASGQLPSDSLASRLYKVENRVSQYSRLVELYQRKARQISRREIPTDSLRSIDSIDSKEQVCAVLADLLGVRSNVISESVQSDPGLSSDDYNGLLFYARSLESYIKASSPLLSQDEFSWKYQWNLSCSGRYNSQEIFSVSDPRGYRISLSSDGANLKIVGDITPTLFEGVEYILKTNSTVREVEIASAGGSIGSAMKIGRLIRRLQLNTALRSDCYSSCTLVFIAGKRRFVYAPYYSLGFHRISQFGSEIALDHADYSAIKNYADDMIGNGDEVVRYWKSGSGEYFFRPDRRMLCTSRLATTVEGVCASN